MGKTVTAEYDATEKTLRLVEALVGVRDHEKVQVTINQTLVVDPERPWLALSGTLSQEAGESLSRALDELFPPWND